MKNILNSILIVTISIILASLYGALHNQISYSISDEFFKNFLFGNFGVNEWGIENERTKATIVGILGTYWMGFYLGLIYVIIYLFLSIKSKFSSILKAIIINLSTAFVCAIIALIISHFFIAPESSGVYMDFGTLNPKNYADAVFMHNGSYIGGVLGLILGISYLYKKSITSNKTLTHA